mmetsp:Transcript_35243/g.83574  ORF Transcript_35243/g.83574 Transcript_35243/m.83574 type:complete len:386 (+) Transcript_35243:499-1656(+)
MTLRVSAAWQVAMRRRHETVSMIASRRRAPMTTPCSHARSSLPRRTRTWETSCWSCRTRRSQPVVGVQGASRGPRPSVRDRPEELSRPSAGAELQAAQQGGLGRSAVLPLSPPSGENHAWAAASEPGVPGPPAAAVDSRSSSSVSGGAASGVGAEGGVLCPFAEAPSVSDGARLAEALSELRREPDGVLSTELVSSREERRAPHLPTALLLAHSASRAALSRSVPPSSRPQRPTAPPPVCLPPCLPPSPAGGLLCRAAPCPPASSLCQEPSRPRGSGGVRIGLAPGSWRPRWDAMRSPSSTSASSVSLLTPHLLLSSSIAAIACGECSRPSQGLCCWAEGARGSVPDPAAAAAAAASWRRSSSRLHSASRSRRRCAVDCSSAGPG